MNGRSSAHHDHSSHRAPTQPRQWRSLTVAAVLLLAGCAEGDFGRIKSSLVADSIHDWVGTEAPGRQGKPRSQFPLTDAERQLRDYAYPVIEPPYDRQRWYSILFEYGINGGEPPLYLNAQTYTDKLLSTPVRSQSARYSRLIDDIRADVVRVDPFFSVARYVLSMDRKRTQMLKEGRARNKETVEDARVRMAENRAVIGWVQQSLRSRGRAYQMALEQLAVMAPLPMAAEAERSLALLHTRIAAHQGLLQAEMAEADVERTPFNAQ
jgi:hypothetical protein